MTFANETIRRFWTPKKLYLSMFRILPLKYKPLIQRQRQQNQIVICKSEKDKNNRKIEGIQCGVRTFGLQVQCATTPLRPHDLPER